MISTLLDRLFQRSNVSSGTKVKQRLKFILAHDRAAIEPQVFDNMRHEIMRVVSKYVQLDEDSLDIRLESDKRMTALIANLPILTIREELPDLVSLFDQPDQQSSSEPQADPIALEMDQFADAALDAIAAQDKPQPTSDPENVIKNVIENASENSPESVSEGSPKNSIENVIENASAIAEYNAEHNREVTNKIRAGANKSVSQQEEKEVVVEEDVFSDRSANASKASESEVVEDQEPADQLELSLGIRSDALDANHQ